MPGDTVHNSSHQKDEATPHCPSHFEPAHNKTSAANDKNVSTHEHVHKHPALFNSLSPKDWQHHPGAAKAPTMAEAAHLPKTEITGLHADVHKDAQCLPGDRQRALKHDLLDQSKNANQRLGAAHKLLSSHTSEIVDKDQHGKPLHLHIAETKEGKDTHIVVLQIEGKTTHTYLEGTVDPTGKVIMAMSAAPPEEFLAHQHRAVNHAEHEAGFQAGHHHRQHSNRPAAETVNAGPTCGNGNEPQYQESPQYQETPQYQELPNNSNIPLSAGSDIDGLFQQAQAATGAVTDKMIKLPDGSVYMRTHLMVDADGGPEWNIDSSGQAGTSLRNSDGSPLNAKAVNYFVLPMGEQWKRMGIKLGDVAWVRNEANGKIVAAIFGDEGPHNKNGEGSQALCRALGLSDDPNHGGTDKKNIEFLIMPHSGTGKGDIAKDPMQMASRLNGQTANRNVA